jgi:hypothetical protein
MKEEGNLILFNFTGRAIDMTIDCLAINNIDRFKGTDHAVDAPR